MDLYKRVSNSVSEKNEHRLFKPGSTLRRVSWLCLYVSIGVALLLVSPFFGVTVARIVNPNYNCTSYFECEVHCFVNPNARPVDNAQGILAACGGMGFIGYLLLILISWTAVLLYRVARRLCYEVYCAFYPEHYTDEIRVMMRIPLIPFFNDGPRGEADSSVVNDDDDADDDGKDDDNHEE